MIVSGEVLEQVVYHQDKSRDSRREPRRSARFRLSRVSSLRYSSQPEAQSLAGRIRGLLFASQSDALRHTSEQILSMG